MAHHSRDPFSGQNDEMLRAMFAARTQPPKREELGATGEYPQGKLTPEDEGEIRIGVTVFNGKVVIDFGKPIVWMGMDPQQALDIGELLIRRAREASAAGDGT